MLFDELRIIQVGKIPNQGACAVNAACNFIEFIIDKEKAMVFCDPSLVRVAYIRISACRNRHRVFFIRYVRNAERCFIGTKADFFALMVGIGIGSFLIGALREFFDFETLYRLSIVYPLLVIALAVGVLWARRRSRQPAPAGGE